MPDSSKSCADETVHFIRFYLVSFAACLMIVPSYVSAASIAEDPHAEKAPDVSELSSSYDRTARTLYIGSHPFEPQPASDMTVVVSRASDLVGVPLKITTPSRRAGTLPGESGKLPIGTPLTSLAVSSGFGLRTNPISGLQRQHQGIDLAARMGTPVTATSDGTVDVANWVGGYGLLVVLKHGGGVQTRYGHLARLSVSAGQRIRKGEVIGYVGSTGNSTGPHLHYEVRINGRAMNPTSLLHQ